MSRFKEWFINLPWKVSNEQIVYLKSYYILNQLAFFEIYTFSGPPFIFFINSITPGMSSTHLDYHVWESYAGLYTPWLPRLGELCWARHTFITTSARAMLNSIHLDYHVWESYVGLYIPWLPRLWELCWALYPLITTSVRDMLGSTSLDYHVWESSARLYTPWLPRLGELCPA